MRGWLWVTLLAVGACRGTIPDDKVSGDPIDDKDNGVDSDPIDPIDTDTVAESDPPDESDPPLETDPETDVVDTDPPEDSDPPVGPTDQDSDGAIAELDCDDGDPLIFPGATEQAYDGVDNDCDPLTADDDLDADGFVLLVDCDDLDPALNPGAAEDAYTGLDEDCDPLSPDDDLDADGWRLVDDCDDLDAAVRPDGEEACNTVDDDCDGVVDEDVPGSPVWYVDLDGDRYGDPAAPRVSCTQPEFTVDDATDCDDRVPSVHPNATELCDGLDNDCNQLIDDGALDDGTFYRDGDGDGFGDLATALVTCTPPAGYVPAPGDCRDDLADVWPGAVELCDGVDQDCDGVVDDNAADAGAWYADGDGDGWGGAARVVACAPGDGWAPVGGDCDDGDRAVSPDGVESCDGEDEDCDGEVDEGAVDPGLWFGDGDGDGFGAGLAELACAAPPGTVGEDGDCEDGDDSIFPGQEERCDGVDEDCDGLVDDRAVDPAVWYGDADGDGWGVLASVVIACEAPVGFAAAPGDCLDNEPRVYPGAVELCDGLDNDCSGVPDSPSPLGGQTFYADLDGDGYGDPASPILACALPPAASVEATDCDDGDRRAFPGAVELCDGVDQDCDGLVDEDAVDPELWYVDEDGDGYGGAVSVLACEAPAGAVAVGEDCNDAVRAISPGTEERCNGRDDDCDLLVDEGAAAGSTSWHFDGDGDGYGGPVTVDRCAQPAGYVADATDCDDGDRATSPAASELCNGRDDDCDALIDEEAVGAGSWFADSDGDGFGGGAPIVSCAAPEGTSARADDCADDDVLIFPGAEERCNGLDDDCDRSADEGAAGGVTWFRDGDRDGFGDAGSSQLSCLPPVDHVADSTDCDDGDRTANPAAPELCDGADDDCDGLIDEGAPGDAAWYTDADQDGWGTGLPKYHCTPPARSVQVRGDCNDGERSVHPEAPERCNNVDDDCDSEVDEGEVIGGNVFYADEDDDLYGDPNVSVLSCSRPPGFVTNGSDCDDAASHISPWRAEVCNGIDDNCDGLVDQNLNSGPAWYTDADLDGFGVGEPLLACTQPEGMASLVGDCDDLRVDVFLGAREICDGLDNDCDAEIDEGVGGGPWYVDVDNDGYGSEVGEVFLCVQPPGTIAVGGDCNDRNASVNPSSPEVCNSRDDDCDGALDEDPIDPVERFTGDADGDGFGTVLELRCARPGDNFFLGFDCDDTNRRVNPGTSEVCNGLDDDCDGQIDDTGPGAPLIYPDNDGDGYGSASGAIPSCRVLDGFVAFPYDCDDENGSANPGVAEVCDGVDNDCDDVVDEAESTSELAWSIDSDGDGFGGEDGLLWACVAPDGYGPPGDCDDGADTVFPGADELCNRRDDDCNNRVDDEPVDRGTWYLDADRDGFGQDDVTLLACSQPRSYAALPGDCDDLDLAINPAAEDVCNGTDDDCDGEIDFVGAPDAVDWYQDLDCDRQGDPASLVRACEAPGPEWTDDGGDCDDSDPRKRTGGVEACDGEDDDCDGVVDEGCINLIGIPQPSGSAPASIAAPGACARIGELSAGYDVHVLENLPQFMAILDGTLPGLNVVTEVEAPSLDWSTRCGANHLASIGNFSPTNPWPNLGDVGPLGSGKFRGYLHIGCGEPTERTIGLIGNDSVRLLIEGQTILEQNWYSNRWKKFRWVSFPGPGLYAFEVQWSTNLNCNIDPMEVVWADSLLPGYESYDTMCNSGACAYGDGAPIPGFRVVDGSELSSTLTGEAGSCEQCSIDADCAVGVCGPAGLCE